MPNEHALEHADSSPAPGFRPEVLAGPEHLQRRRAVEAALFGGVAEAISFGRYRMLHHLGQGGMGSVYAAYDDHLDRKIALKLIRPSRKGNAEIRERTLREARALARLSHPNVVHVYEVGEIEDQMFVAMEFLAGPTLRNWLDGQERPWRERLAVLRQAGEGLAAAHAQGIVHRDFKPHNVMFGADGRARVLDFGLARLGEGEGPDPSELAGAERGPEQTLTRTGSLLGTPAYMAPEQFTTRKADARSDQFAFSVVLFEALYGHRPFGGETLAALAEDVTSGRVTPRPKDTKVPPWVHAVVLRGLARDPEQRFGSMNALLAALADDPTQRRRRRLAALASVALVGAGVWGAIALPAREPGRCTGLDDKLAGTWDVTRRAEVEAALVGTGLSYAQSTWERVERHMDDYAAAWVDMRTEACKATERGEQSAELLDLRMVCLDERLSHVRATVDLLAQADDKVVEHAVEASTNLPTLERCSDADALTAEIPPPDDPAVAKRVAELREQLVQADALERSAKFADGLAIVDEVVSASESVEYEPLQARALLDQGDLQRQTGSYKTAVATLERAYEAALGLRMTAEAAGASSILMHVLGSDMERYADARSWARHAKALARAAGTDTAQIAYLANLATVAQRESNLAEARELLEQALPVAEHNPRSLLMARTLLGLGNVATAQRRMDDARAYCERALALYEELFGPDHPYFALALTNLGSLTMFAGQYDEARAYLERALAAYEAALGPEHPDLGYPLVRLGDVALWQGRFEEARRHQERALAIFERSKGPEHPDVARALGNLGMVSARQGAYDDARAYLHRALPIMERSIGPEHKDVAFILTSLGNVEENTGNLKEARRYFERVLAICEKTLGPKHTDTAIPLHGLGNVAWREKRYQDARAYFERVIAIVEGVLGPESLQVANSLSMLGMVALGEKQPARAIPSLERALKILERQERGSYAFALPRFHLARALWDAPADQGRDRERARELVALARDGFIAAGEKGKGDLEEVEAWLREHSTAAGR